MDSSVSGDEVAEWCQQYGLTEDTVRVLTEEGFTSLQYLSLLTAREVGTAFKDSHRLSLAQCLALQHALPSLQQDQGQGQGQGQAGPMSPGIQWSASLPHQSGGDKSNHAEDDFMMEAENNAAIILGQPPQRTPPSPLQDVQSSSCIAQRASPPASPQPLSLGSAWSAGACGPSPYLGQDEVYRFLLVGKTGSGKSTTGNSILGAELFDADVAFDSQTNRNQLKRANVHGRTIEIMDSPGLFDTGRSHEDISLDIVQAVACMHPGPHALLYVIRLGRYTQEEYEVYQRLKALFDEHVTRHVIIVFTGGDGLEKEGKDIGEVLRRVPDSLSTVLQDCRYRVVVFNNMADDTQPYVQQFFEQVDMLLRSNDGRYYTCPKYAEVGEGMEEEVGRRLQQLEEQQLADKPLVKELKKKAEVAEEDLQEERRRFEEREKERGEEVRAAEERAKAEMASLMKEMQDKDLSMQQQQQEKGKLVEQHEAHRQELRRQMERQRQEDHQQLDKKTQELQKILQKTQEEQERRQEAMKNEYRRKMAQMKDCIARGKEGNFLRKLVAGVRGVVHKVVAFFSPAKALALTGAAQ